MNYQKILEVLKEKLEDVYSFAHEDYEEEELGLGKIEEVDSYGGEDCGSEWYSVKYFSDHDVYIRVDGYYSSYEGVDFYDGWDCCSNVRPKEKVITVYE